MRNNSETLGGASEPPAGPGWFRLGKGGASAFSHFTKTLLTAPTACVCAELGPQGESHPPLTMGKVPAVAP